MELTLTIEDYNRLVLSPMVLDQIQRGRLDAAILDIAEDDELLGFFDQQIKDAVVKRYKEILNANGAL